MYTTETNRVLTDAELDEVNGGDVANACIKATINWMRANTYQAEGFHWDLRRELGCPPGGA